MNIYEDELSVLEAEIGGATPHDPLDLIALAGEDTEPKPDADIMMALLYHPDSQQRMLGARAFCEIEDTRAIPFLIG
ncbi:MAG: HEAT repeat domain-containing protein, partial [Cyanobacteria bacterium J06648_10]